MRKYVVHVYGSGFSDWVLILEFRGVEIIFYLECMYRAEGKFELQWGVNKFTEESGYEILWIIGLLGKCFCKLKLIYELGGI